MKTGTAIIEIIVEIALTVRLFENNPKDPPNTIETTNAKIGFHHTNWKKLQIIKAKNAKYPIAPNIDNKKPMVVDLP